MKTMTFYLPEKKCSTVKVETIAPETVRVGTPFEYHLKVTNTSKSNLHDVTAFHRMPDGFRFEKATPEISSTAGDRSSWNLGTLRPGETKTIQIRGSASRVSSLGPCLEVSYRFEGVCSKINVVEPGITVSHTVPENALLCDTIPIKVMVKNVGTSKLCNVMVRDPLPDGLTTMEGEKALSWSAGTLKPGESREYSATLKAARTGSFDHKVVATADGGARAFTNDKTIHVTQPELAIRQEAPDMRYIGRPIMYTFTVTNGPKTPASNTVLSTDIPGGASFVEASNGGKLEGGRVTWFLGNLQPRDGRKVTLTLRADSPGMLHNRANVTADCGEAATEGSVRIMGVPAILLEVVDLDDPVELNENVTYEIAVTNQGSAVDRSVAIVAELPSALKYISSDGPTKATIDGNKITFAPLDSLEPKAKATWKITAKAIDTGDVRFRVTLNSSNLTEAAFETEATRLYK
jgi:uncharacterized repeat protein (TIGR01451 family)